MVLVTINNSIAEALSRAGLMPAECRSVTIIMEPDSLVVLRYEVLLTRDQVHALGLAMMSTAVEERLTGGVEARGGDRSG